MSGWAEAPPAPPTSTSAAPTAHTGHQVAAPVARTGWVRPATFGDVVRSEATKLRTVRSTWVTLALAAVLTVGIGALICLAQESHYSSSSPSDRATFDPTMLSQSGYFLAQVAFAVLGVLFVTSEYSSGMIRITLAAVPRRPRLLGAKLIVFAGVVLVLGEILAFVSFFVGQAILGLGAPTVAIGNHDVLRAVIGTGLYLTVLGVIAVAFGTLLRSTAGAITSIIALLFVLPGIANALPTSWRRSVEKFWPTNAGQQLVSVVRGSHTLSPWAGFADMCVFTAIIAVLALVVLNRRDA